MRCNIPPIQFEVTSGASAAIPNGLVICRGRFGNQNCLRLTAENKWVSFPDLNWDRSQWFTFDMFYMNKKLWTIGRGSGYQYIDPIKSSYWTYVSTYPSRRLINTCSAELPNNRIINTGGSFKHVSRWKCYEIRYFQNVITIDNKLIAMIL